MSGLPVEQLVRLFYDDAWNRWDDSVVELVLAEAFAFRGSLGDEVRGRAGWRAYRDTVRAAIPDFRNEVVDLVADGHRAAVRLRCHGHHEGELLGVRGDGRPVSYSAAAFFTATDGRLAEAWVLGDLDGLKSQLR